MEGMHKNMENRIYNMKDVFEQYCKYVNYDGIYSSSFSNKVKDRLKKYYLGDYKGLIEKGEGKGKGKGKGKGNYFKPIYFFNEKEKDMMALFYGCTTSRLGKGKGEIKQKYDINKLNPFCTENRNPNLGISDLYGYIENLLEYIDENFNLKDWYKKDFEERLVPQINLFELQNIFDKIKLSMRLKEALERILVSLFYQDKYDVVTTEFLLLRLEGFADEIDILNAIKNESTDEMIEKISSSYKNNLNMDFSESYSMYFVNKYKKMTKKDFESADVSIAAALGDLLSYYSYVDNGNYSAQEKARYRMMSGNYWGVANVNNEPIHRQLSNRTTKTEKEYLQDIFRQKSYIKYIKTNIKKMVNELEELLRNKTQKSKVEIKRFFRKYGISPNLKDTSSYRLETILFETYINPGMQAVLEDKCTSSELINDIYNKIDSILEEAKNETKEKIKNDEYELSRDIDRLVFKPFVRFHNLDMQELQKRMENNPVL